MESFVEQDEDDTSKENDEAHDDTDMEGSVEQEDDTSKENDETNKISSGVKE